MMALKNWAKQTQIPGNPQKRIQENLQSLICITIMYLFLLRDAQRQRGLNKELGFLSSGYWGEGRYLHREKHLDITSSSSEIVHKDNDLVNT
jgi:hypothetical protein